jgi:hypothetical protein
MIIKGRGRSKSSGRSCSRDPGEEEMTDRDTAGDPIIFIIIIINPIYLCSSLIL